MGAILAANFSFKESIRYLLRLFGDAFFPSEIAQNIAWPFGGVNRKAGFRAPRKNRPMKPVGGPFLEDLVPGPVAPAVAAEAAGSARILFLIC